MSDDRSTTLAERRQRLQRILQGRRRWLVAFSGGVDSTYLLHAAVQAVGAERVLGVTGVSASLAARERQETLDLAARIGAPHRWIETREIDNPDYAANAGDRCYFCKSELFDRLLELARDEGYDAVADGTNAGDVGDVRPGREAAAQRGVASPLLEAGLDKQDIRALSRDAGLPTWDKPEMACLASRIPHGTPVDAAKLRQVETAEDVLWQLGLRGARVRHHGPVARIELQPGDWDALADEGVRSRLVAGIQAAGFERVAVDLEPYARGGARGRGTQAAVSWRPKGS